MINFNYTLFIQFFNLLVLLILLHFVLFKPVLKALAKRESTLGSLSENVRAAGDNLETLEKKYSDGTKEKKKPVLEDRESLVAEAAGTSVRMVEKARLDLTEELSRIRADIGTDSKKVLEALKGEVDRLSSEAAEKIMRRSIP